MSNEPEIPVVPEVEVPVVEVLPDTTDKQISMSQSALDGLIKSRQAAALKKAAALETENQRLKEIAAGQGADASELERIRGELSASKIERDAIAASAAQAKKESFISGQVSKQGFVCDSQTLARLTQDDITFNEATKQFETADGTSADDFFKRFADSRPYLVKSSVISGSGGSSSVGSTVPSRIPLEKIFGPSSDSRIANQIALGRIAGYDYAALKREAQRKGLCS